MRQIVAAPSQFRNFRRILKPRLISEKNKEVTENREVQKIVGTPIFRGNRRYK